MTGYISVHRKLMNSAIWSDPNYLKLWLYCLFKASHKEHELLVGNQMVKLSRGQFITGRKKLTEEMNEGVKPEQKLSEKSWERHLKNLEKWQMLTIEVTNKFSLVTVGKYDFYQGGAIESDQVNDQQVTNSCPTSDQQLTTNNNGNKGNNDNKESKTLIHEKVLNHWTSKKGFTQHRKLTDSMKRSINGRLTDYTLEEILETIDLYHEVVSNDKYYYTYLFTLERFMEPKKFVEFTKESNPLERYLSKKGGNYASNQPTTQRASNFPTDIGF
jgi:hypothetical protein